MVTPISRVEELKIEGFDALTLKDLYARHEKRVHKGQYADCKLCEDYVTDITALKIDEVVEKKEAKLRL